MDWATTPPPNVDTLGLYHLAVSCAQKDVSRKPNMYGIANTRNSKEERGRWSRVSVLAFGTQVRGFKPGRRRRIFKGK